MRTSHLRWLLVGLTTLALVAACQNPPKMESSATPADRPLVGVTPANPIFTGTASLFVDDPTYMGPYLTAIRIQMHLDATYTVVTFDAPSPVVIPAAADSPAITITVTPGAAAGTYHAVSRAIRLPVRMTIANGSTTLIGDYILAPDEVSITGMSRSGTVVNNFTGDVTLVGASEMKIAGIWDGPNSLLVVSGTLLPVPKFILAGSSVADGTLLREANTDSVHVVYGGARYWIVSPAEFQASGFDWNEVQVVPDGALAGIPIVPSHGTLVRERDRAEVYVVYGGAKFWVPSPEEFEALGHDWNRVYQVPQGSLALIPNLPVDGTRVMERGGPEIFIVAGGHAFHFPGMDEFFALTDQPMEVRVLPLGSLKKFPKIPADKTLVRERDSQQIWQFWGGKRAGLPIGWSLSEWDADSSQVRNVPKGALQNFAIIQ